MFLKNSHKRNLFLSTSTMIAMAAGLMMAPMANAIVPNDNNEGEAAVDNEGGVNGIGMMFTSQGGVCTGTLINPRTVLFAAHCVNSRPETDYGTTVDMSFSFNVDNFPALLEWFNGGRLTNVANNIFTVNQVQYHPDSLLNPQARGFLEADIALATLDTPAADIPTWALLFSALPAPDQLDPLTGTGYHVNIAGYGRTGNGTFGDFQGIDFRRRAAENMLGALTSIDEFDTLFFGTPSGLPQNLYWTDFDDPNQADPFDFNLFLDEPVENEGTTAGGDSGGPLILDAANNDLTDIDLQIGVLSGGGGLFGNNSAYGEYSIYQPLYLFADYIAATNPYRYVSTVAGDGNWEDASHWQTDVDPNYFVIDGNGAVVNGFPDEQPDGITGSDGDYGASCFDTHPRDEPRTTNCIDYSTGEFIPAPAEEGNQAGPANAAAFVDPSVFGAAQRGSGDNSASLEGGNTIIDLGNGNFQQGVTAQSGGAVIGAGPLPAPTIENGLAGATGFVPNNIDPDAAANTRGRYFDVTLSADGTTTLSSDVEIDRLTLNGAGARLDVASGGSLTSLIDIQQMRGWVDVDGRITSVGDYLLMSGMLSGTGTIETPFLTSVLGVISPGAEMGEIGTLTIDGSAVFSSGTTLLIDLAESQNSDRIVITGDSSLGGQVFFNPTAETRNGNAYEFLVTQGTQSGEFTTQGISPLLDVVLSHENNTVVARIVAGSFDRVIDENSKVQNSYAQLLDHSREIGTFNEVLATLDLSTAESIRAVLDSWAPVSETTTRSLAKTSTDHVARLHRDRLDGMMSDSWGGKMTVMGSPVQMASNAQYATVMSDVATLQAAEGQIMQTNVKVPNNYEIFVAGAFIDGDGSPMPNNQSFGEEDFDGFSISGGIEHRFSDMVSFGTSLTYTTLDADASLNQSVETDHLAASFYGQVRSKKNVVMDGQVRIGSLKTETLRNVAFPNPISLRSESTDMTYGFDLRVSRPTELGQAVFVPRASLQTNVIQYDDVEEFGGFPGLQIDRDQHMSTQGRIGFAVNSADNAKVSLSTYADLVTELGEVDDDFDARFVGAGTPTANFALFGTDKTWGELGIGLGFNMDRAKISLSADTTVGRSDLEARTYRAGISYKF